MRRHELKILERDILVCVTSLRPVEALTRKKLTDQLILSG